MDVHFTCNPSYTLGYCTLGAGESVMVERGAMAAMSDGLDVSIGFGGGFSKAVMRRVFGGEGLLMVRYTAATPGAWVAVAPPYPGDMIAVDVGRTDGMRVEAGALVAFDAQVDVSTKYGGLEMIVLREGATTLHLAGSGTAVLSSYGGIQRFMLAAGEQIVVDTGHLLGFDDSVDIDVSTPAGLATSALSGEGLVARLRGPGKVLVQTRAEQDLVSWLMPHRSQNARTR